MPSLATLWVSADDEVVLEQPVERDKSRVPSDMACKLPESPTVLRLITCLEVFIVWIFVIPTSMVSDSGCEQIGDPGNTLKIQPITNTIYRSSECPILPKRPLEHMYCDRHLIIS